MSDDTAVLPDVVILRDYEPAVPCAVWSLPPAWKCPDDADYAVDLLCELCGPRRSFVCDACLYWIEEGIGYSTGCRGNPVCAATGAIVVDLVAITPLA